MVGLAAKGWTRFGYDAGLARWADAARAAALVRMAEPAHRAEWLQCQGTWFVGVDTLTNAPDGSVGGVPLCGPGFTAACADYGDLPLHAAQVSVVYPGYPKPREGEGEGAFRYRLNRDAAHVDGLLPVGEARARMLKERHAYILGLPLNDASADAAPLVIWEGSHEIMRAAFHEALKNVPSENWGEVDLTEIYQATRRDVFERCPRVVLAARKGEAVLVHRLALHGVAPWGDTASAPEEGRMIAYFGPEFQGDGPEWIAAP